MSEAAHSESGGPIAVRKWIGDVSAERIGQVWRAEDHEALLWTMRAADDLTLALVALARRETLDTVSQMNEREHLDGIRSNRWGLAFAPTVINRLRKVGIYGQPQLSLEHQGRAKRYVVRGVESGGAGEDVGYYISFAGENGEALPWLQTIDSLTVNGPHAVVIAPVLTRIEIFRVARTYELCITRHRPVAVETRQRPTLEAVEVFRGVQGYLALEIWGKDKDLRGCVRPQFFTRSGEEIELPDGFDEAVKAATSGVTCLACSHPHYSRLVAPPSTPAHEEQHEPLVSADIVAVAQGV